MKVLIFGITGQDGSLLSKYLLKKGFLVIGTTRDLNKLNQIANNDIKIHEIDVLNYRQINELIKLESPDIIYNLSGQTSVGKSFFEPLDTYQTIVNTTMYILESIRKINTGIKFFNASSTECFGFNNKIRLTEKSLFNPISPYGTAKVMAYNLVNNYRSIYGIYTCTGIFSNHESQFRSENFISRKIIEAAYNISIGSQDFLEIGDIKIVRDWGWAEDFIEAIFLMMNQNKPGDYIIATGKSISLEEFIYYTFKKFNLDYKKHLKVNKLLFRINEIQEIYLNPQKVFDDFGWKAKNDVYKVIDKLIDFKCNRTM